MNLEIILVCVKYEKDWKMTGKKKNGVKMCHIQRKIVIFWPILQVYSYLSPSVKKNQNMSNPPYQNNQIFADSPLPSVADIICERPLIVEDGKNSEIYYVGKIMPGWFFKVLYFFLYYTSPWITKPPEKYAFTDSTISMALTFLKNQIGKNGKAFFSNVSAILNNILNLVMCLFVPKIKYIDKPDFVFLLF